MDAKTFNQLLSLYDHQNWLKKREGELIRFLKEARKYGADNLSVELLSNFEFLDQTKLNFLLLEMADHVVRFSNFCEEKAQIVALGYNKEIDSSQAVLQFFKNKLFQAGWTKFRTAITVGVGASNSKKKGLTDIVLVDEFSGTGRTVLNQVRYLEKNCGEGVRIIVYLVAAMESAIEAIRTSGVAIYCPLILKKGITDQYSGPDLDSSMETMRYFESSLHDQYPNVEFADYSFGHGTAESLYSGEEVLGNTPNSVFPVFWWPRKKDGIPRPKVLSRFEKDIN